MHEAVSDVLVERARGRDGMSRMVAVSFAAHASLLALLFVLPRGWMSAETPAVTPMMISLAGVAGPDAGGMTPISSKRVDEVAPPDAVPKPEPRPAAKPPEMVEPAPAKPVPPKPLPKPPAKADVKPTVPARRPNMGPEIKAGAAAVPTPGAAVPFGGLSTGGGQGTGATLDVADFCCPLYVSTMVDLIRRNWNRNQGAIGQVKVKFTIQRDGTLTNIMVEQPSNNGLLDMESHRAVLKTKQLPSLPREFPESTLTVHLIFDYQR